jgi:hypothetical protein
VEEEDVLREEAGDTRVEVEDWRREESEPTLLE